MTDNNFAITAEQVLELGLTEFPTLLRGVLPKKDVAALAGSSDLGKSYLLQQLCIAVASGENQFIGFDLIVEHHSAIYVSTEDNDYSMCVRLNQMKRLLNDHSLRSLKFIFDPIDIIRKLDAELQKQPASLVVIDTFTDLFKGSLNESVSVRNYIMQYKLLANRHNCLIIFNHHCGKRNELRPPSKDNLLGSQGFESSMRTVIELRQDFDIHEKRHLCIVKGNNVPPENKYRSFELTFDIENGFQATGNRVPFGKLYINSKHDNSAVAERAYQLKREGSSYRQIASELKKEGFKIEKSKVGDLLRRHVHDLKNDQDQNQESGD